MSDIDHTTNSPLKRCSHCKAPFPATPDYFHRHKVSKDGLHNMCKLCQRASAKRNPNPRKYTENRREQFKIWGPRSYRKHREKRLASQKQYREDHHDRDYQIHKRYRETHRDVINAAAQRRRALKLNATGIHTKDDVQRQYKSQKGHCYWCNIKVDKVYHVDHVIPLSRGGSNGPENIVISCPTCNMKKNNKLPHEWTGSNGKLL